MKKQHLISVVLIGVGAWLTCSSFTTSSSEVEEPTTTTTTTTTAETTTSQTILEDVDGNGIPDKIEAYYDSHIRDQYAFGIGLGALIGGLINIVSSMWIMYKNGKFTHDVKVDLSNYNKLVSAMEEANKEFNKKLEEVESNYDKQKVEYQKTIDELTRQCEVLVNEMKESTKQLSYFTKYEEKLNKILEVLKTMNDTDENLQSGLLEKINEIIEKGE